MSKLMSSLPLACRSKVVKTLVAIAVSGALSACNSLTELSNAEILDGFAPAEEFRQAKFGPDQIEIQTHNRKPEIEGGLGPVCFPVSAVRVTGLDLVKTQSVYDAIEPFAFECQGVATVRAILLAINGIHSDRGLITTQAYLPEQNIVESRKILIDVVPGRNESLSYDEDRIDLEGWPWDRLMTVVKRPIGEPDHIGHHLTLIGRKALDAVEVLDDPIERFEIFPSANPITAFPKYEGEVFSIERIQQGLDQINAAKSASAAVKLQAGEEPASSKLVVANTVRDSFRGTLGFDVNGSEVTGTNRLKLTVEKDNFVGVNDRWSASIMSGRDNNELTGSISVPYKWLNATLAGDYSEYLIPLGPTAELFGYGHSIKPSVSATILRLPDHKTKLHWSGSYKTSERFVNATRLTPQTFTSMRVGVSEERTFETSKLSYSAGLSLGLDLFDSLRDEGDFSVRVPRSQFYKLDAGASYTKAWQKQATLTSVLSTQWAQTALYGDAQLSMGSTSVLRGFKQDGFSADRGFTLTNELSLDLLNNDWAGRSLATLFDEFENRNALSLPAWLRPQLGSMEPYTFLDIGGGQAIASDTGDLLVSTGAGLRYKRGRLSFSLLYGQPVWRVDRDLPDNGELFFDMNYKIF